MIPKHKPSLGIGEYVSLLNPRMTAVEDFEHAFAAAVKSKHAVAFPYGRSGLFAVLESEGIRGAEILMPAYTCIVVANAVVASGNTPRFIDIALDDYNVDPMAMASSLTRRTRAVIPTHMYGYALDVNCLRSLINDERVLIVEDACLALLSEGVGRYSDATFYSLNIGKQITTFDGGIVTTDRDDLCTRLRDYRDRNFTRTSFVTTLKTICLLIATPLAFTDPVYGVLYGIWRNSSVLKAFTKNWSLDNVGMPHDYLRTYTSLQANIGLAQLGKLNDAIKKREDIARLYDATLTGVRGITLPPIRAGATYSHYTVRTSNRTGIIESLAKHGVHAGLSFDYCIPQTPAYAEHAGNAGFRNSALAAEQVLNLPIYPSLTRSKIQHICDIIARAAEQDD